MPSAPTLAPDIPNLIEIHMDDNPYKIPLTLGYDTVSCVCGTADCSTFCNSDTDISVKFTDK